MITKIIIITILIIIITILIIITIIESITKLAIKKAIKTKHQNLLLALKTSLSFLTFS